MRRTELGMGVALWACVIASGELRCARAIDVEGGVGGVGGAGEGASGTGAPTANSASSTGSASTSSASSSGGMGGGLACVPGSTEPCYSGPPATMGVGLCQEGIKTCDSAGIGFGPCVGEVTPSAETCATPGDEDCDGQTNEEGAGCTCTPGAMMPCYSGPSGTEGVGMCVGGTQICLPGGTGYGACNGEVTPVPEDCSTAVDDNCNGEINEASAGCSQDCPPTCTLSPSGDCPSDVVVVGHYQGGNRQVCIGQGDGSSFRLALMSYETTNWTLSGAISRVSAIQIYTFNAFGSIMGNGTIPTSIQHGGTVPANPYSYGSSLGDCPVHTGYAGAVFGIPQASVCHMEIGLPSECSYPSYTCLSITP